MSDYITSWNSFVRLWFDMICLVDEKATSDALKSILKEEKEEFVPR